MKAWSRASQHIVRSSTPAVVPSRCGAAGVVLLLIVMLGCAGCALPMPIPHPVTTAYRTRGAIIDQHTDKPVPGARICYEGREDLAFYADEQGRFDIPEQNDLVLVSFITPCPVIDFPKPHHVPGAALVSKEGYQTRKIVLRPYYEQQLSSRRGPRFIFELGELRLTANRPVQTVSAHDDVGKTAGDPAKLAGSAPKGK